MIVKFFSMLSPHKRNMWESTHSNYLNPRGGSRWRLSPLCVFSSVPTSAFSALIGFQHDFSSVAPTATSLPWLLQCLEYAVLYEFLVKWAINKSCLLTKRIPVNIREGLTFECDSIHYLKHLNGIYFVSPKVSLSPTVKFFLCFGGYVLRVMFIYQALP